MQPTSKKGGLAFWHDESKKNWKRPTRILRPICWTPAGRLQSLSIFGFRLHCEARVALLSLSSPLAARGVQSSAKPSFARLRSTETAEAAYFSDSIGDWGCGIHRKPCCSHTEQVR